MIGEAPRPVNSSAVVIAGAACDDLDPVMEIMATSFEPTFGEAWTRSQCAGILPMAGVSLRLASHDGQIVGFALMRAVADEAELLLIAVNPAARKNGVGTALVEDFVQLARHSGARRLHLEVRDGNPAIALYHRLGFRLVGRRRDYYRGLDGRTRDALTLAINS